MPTPPASGDWTHPDARAISHSLKRLDGAKCQLEELGRRFITFWVTKGQHDMVLVYGTLDGSMAARRTLVPNGLGSVHTQTMKGLPEAAYRGIVAPIG